MTAAAAPRRWARHLLQGPPAGPAPALSDAEAARVQRHRDRLLAALRSHDRPALRAAQQEVLAAAFAPGTPAGAGGGSGPAPSPALRQALRTLVWRMAALRLPRGRLL